MIYTRKPIFETIFAISILFSLASEKVPVKEHLLFKKKKKVFISLGI